MATSPPLPDQPASPRKAEPKYLPALALVLVLLIAVWGGLQFVRDRLMGDRQADELMRTALRVIRGGYVAEVSPEHLARGAVRGMIASLNDPHSALLPPAENKLLEQAHQGEIGGVGIEVSLRDRDVVVIAPVDDLPAQKAGVLPGDVIVAVDGHNCRGRGLGEVASMIRGIIGTKVAITAQRLGQPDPIEFKLERVAIKVSHVRSAMLDNGIGLVRISLFAERVGEDFGKAVRKLTAQRMRGMILDLRFNPGGIIDEAVAVADALIDEGVIVGTKSRHREEVKVSRASKDKTLTSVPIVVLVNQGTASASEIVAGALQDHERGTVFGVKTFGKGVVCKTVPLPDKSSLVLTVAEYYTPKGRSIEGKGLVPDVEEPTARVPAPRASDQALAKAIAFLNKRI